MPERVLLCAFFLLTKFEANMALYCGDIKCVVGKCSHNNTQCLCESGYTGRSCDSYTSACTSNPCLNGGICMRYHGSYSYYCYCLHSFHGQQCEYWEGTADITCSRCLVHNKVQVIRASVNQTYFNDFCGRDLAKELVFIIAHADGRTKQIICKQSLSICDTTFTKTGCKCTKQAGDIYSYQLQFTFNETKHDGGKLYTEIQGCDIFQRIGQFVPGFGCNLTKSPCLNEGTCTDVRDNYKCQCFSAFTGRHCQVGGIFRFICPQCFVHNQARTIKAAVNQTRLLEACDKLSPQKLEFTIILADGNRSHVCWQDSSFCNATFTNGCRCTGQADNVSSYEIFFSFMDDQHGGRLTIRPDQCASHTEGDPFLGFDCEDLTIRTNCPATKTGASQRDVTLAVISSVVPGVLLMTGVAVTVAVAVRYARRPSAGRSRLPSTAAIPATARAAAEDEEHPQHEDQPRLWEGAEMVGMTPLWSHSSTGPPQSEESDSAID